MEEQRQDAETYDQKQDGYGAVQEESIRQDGDDRVFCRVKKPVIIPKENMMEGHEKIVPVIYAICARTLKQILKCKDN